MGLIKNSRFLKDLQLFLKYWKELGSKPLDNQPVGYMLSYLEVLIFSYLLFGEITEVIFVVVIFEPFDHPFQCGI